MKSVMSVRSFDPELTVSRPGLPSKLPKKMGPGLLPTGKTVGFWSLKKPPPTPGSNITLFDWLLLTRTSGMPSPCHVLDDRGHWAGTDLEPRPRHEGDAVALLLAEQDRDVVRALVGDHQVRPAVAVEVGAGDADDGDADRVGAGEEAMPAIEGGPELAVAQARIDEHVVAAAVGDDQVGDAVAVKIGQLDGAGGEQAREVVCWPPP